MRRPTARAFPPAPAVGSRRPARLPPRPGRPSPQAARTWSRRGSPPPRRRVRAPAPGSPRSWPGPVRGSGRASPISSVLDPDQAGLAAGPGVAAMGEEEVLLTAGAKIGGLDLLHAGLPQQASSDLRQVEHPAAGDPGPEPGERGEHVVADLVAAGADSGSDRGVRSAHRLGAATYDSGGQAAPTAVEYGDAARPGEGNGQAVGGVD